MNSFSSIQRCRRRRAGFTITEIMVASGIAGVISVGAIGTFIFATKVYHNCVSETQSRYEAVRVMDWLKQHLQSASSRAVYASYTNLSGDALDADTEGSYLRFLDSSTNLWNIVYYKPSSRTLYRSQGASLPAPNPSADTAMHDDVESFGVAIKGDGTVAFRLCIVPTNYFKKETRANWIETSSRVFPRNFVQGD